MYRSGDGRNREACELGARGGDRQGEQEDEGVQGEREREAPPLASGGGGPRSGLRRRRRCSSNERARTRGPVSHVLTGRRMTEEDGASGGHGNIDWALDRTVSGDDAAGGTGKLVKEPDSPAPVCLTQNPQARWTVDERADRVARGFHDGRRSIRGGVGRRRRRRVIGRGGRRSERGTGNGGSLGRQRFTGEFESSDLVRHISFSLGRGSLSAGEFQLGISNSAQLIGRRRRGIA